MEDDDDKNSIVFIKAQLYKYLQRQMAAVWPTLNQTQKRNVRRSQQRYIKHSLNVHLRDQPCERCGDIICGSVKRNKEMMNELGKCYWIETLCSIPMWRVPEEAWSN